MKKQHLIALAVVLALLVAARFLLHRRGSDTATDLAQAGVHRVLPKPVDPASVAWVQLTAPAPADGAALAPRRFEKKDGAWVVASRGGAPADGAAIASFVQKAADLAGETRGSGEASWPSYGLGADQAVKVELGGDAGVLGALFIGKQGDAPDTHFVRTDGSADVVHARDGLRSALRLFGTPASLPDDLWIETEVLGLAAADVTRMTVERPDVRVVLERREAPAPASAPEGATGAAPAASWSLSEPSVALPGRDGLEGVVERATQARIAGLLDAESAECTAEPSAVVTFARAAGGETVARVRGMLAGRDQAALTIDGMPHCWSIASWAAGTLAARAPVLWDVPSAFPDAPQGDVARVRIENGGKTIAGTRSTDGAWTVTGGQVEGTRLGSIAGSVRSLRIDDLADAAKVPSALQSVTATVSAEFGGRTLTVRLLGERPGSSGERYARIEGGSKLPPGVIAVLSKSSVASLVP